MNHFQKTAAIAAALAILSALSASAAKKKEPPTAKDAVEKIDQAVKAFQANSKSKVKKSLSEANKILAELPDSEEVSEAKGYYYQTNAEVELLINNNVKAFEENKALCEKYSKERGADINYFAGSTYFDVAMQCLRNSMSTNDMTQKLQAILRQGEYSKKSIDAYLRAFEFDPELDKLTGDDLQRFQSQCNSEKNYSAMATFFDKYLNSKTRFYFKTLGANATAIYETTKGDNPNNIVKAVLCSMLDFEAKENPDGNAVVAVIEKNFNKYKECASAIAFVKKFYSNSPLTQTDLNSLPEGVRDFMPVRYMYKMKTTNDVAALNNEFGAFFGNTANYKARIAAKKIRR